MNKVELRRQLFNAFEGKEVNAEAVPFLQEKRYLDEKGQITGWGKVVCHRSISDGVNYTNLANLGKGTNCASMFFAASAGLRHQVEEKNYNPSNNVRDGLIKALADIESLLAELPEYEEAVIEEAVEA